VGLREVAAHLSGAVWSAAPDEDVAGGGIEFDRWFIGVVGRPGQCCGAAVNDDAEVALAFTVRAHAEVGVGIGIVLTSGDEQDASELADRVVDQVIASEQAPADIIVAGDVPPVQRVLVTEMGDELGDCHVPAGPRDHGVGVAVEHFRYNPTHPGLVRVQAHQQFVVVECLQRCLPFFEAARLWHRITVQVGVEVADNFDGDAVDVRGDFVCGPPVAGADRFGRRRVDRGQKCVRFGAAQLSGVWMLALLYFRADVRGLRRIPKEGPVLLVGNHSGGNVPPDTFVFTLAFCLYFGVERPFYQLAHNLVATAPAGLSAQVRHHRRQPGQRTAGAEVRDCASDISGRRATGR
jgi:hypothetical protein